MKVDTMETSRFRIGEFCKRVGITPQTAREWERRGYIKPLRSCGGHRLYTEHDVADALNGFIETLHHIEKGDVVEVIFAKQSESEQYMAIEAACRKHKVPCFAAVDENGDMLNA